MKKKQHLESRPLYQSSEYTFKNYTVVRILFCFVLIRGSEITSLAFHWDNVNKVIWEPQISSLACHCHYNVNTRKTTSSNNALPLKNKSIYTIFHSCLSQCVGVFYFCLVKHRVLVGLPFRLGFNLGTVKFTTCINTESEESQQCVSKLCLNQQSC